MKYISVIAYVVTHLITASLSAFGWHDITYPERIEKKIDKKVTKTYNQGTETIAQKAKDAAGVVAAQAAKTVDVPTLWSAAHNGNISTVKWLLKDGADPNQQNQSMTALTAALNQGHLSTAKVLLQYGANPRLKENTNGADPKGTTLEYLVSYPEVRGNDNYPSFPKNILQSVCLIVGKTDSYARSNAIKRAYRFALKFKYRAASDHRSFEETVRKPVTSPKQDKDNINANVHLMKQALTIAYLIAKFSPNKRCKNIIKTAKTAIARYFDKRPIKKPGYYMD